MIRKELILDKLLINYMNFWEKFIIPHKNIILVSIFYFILHLTNLTLLPTFNDESIYIDWAWAHTHLPGALYDAQLDAKQPLMIWIFGFFQNFFPDPLYAGRFVSVLFGFLTLLGIYTLSKKVLNHNVAVIASLIYAITPLFVFYNRQALLEAGTACIGIWAAITLINVIKTPTVKNSILLGTVLGFGFFIKSTSLLFVVAATAVFCLYIWKKRQVALFKAYGIAFLSFVCVNFLVFLNPVFWEKFHTNSRYSFTLSEMLAMPITSWMNSTRGFIEIAFFFITPFVFLASIIGMYLFYKKKIKYNIIFIVFFVVALSLEIFSVKSQGQRYLVSLLPFLIIPASYCFFLMLKQAFWKKSLVFLSCIIPFFMTLFLIVNPEDYIRQISKFTMYADTGYIQGQTSGHGIKEALQYMKDDSQGKPAMVLFAFNIGNPESAIDVYAQKSPNLAPMHVDSQMFQGINEIQCFTSQYPVYFITRNDQQVGMDRFFTLKKKFPNPDPTYSVRIYTLKKDCTGNTSSLSDIYGPTMNKIFQMKSGIYY